MTLANEAPSGGILVTIASDDPAATAPASVTIGEGQTVAQFAISTTTVGETTVANIMATSANSISAALTIQPLPCVSSILITTVDFLGSVIGGTSLTAQVNLTGPAPAGGLAVDLTSSVISASTLYQVTVLEGETSALITINTSPVVALVSAVIEATTGACSPVEVTVGVEAPCVAGLSLSLTSVLGGDQVTGTVTLTGPAPEGGREVTLASTGLGVSTPATVLVPAGETSAMFLIETAAVPALLTGTIQALFEGCATIEVDLDILPPILVGVSLADGSFPLLGGSTIGTVTLSGPAPAGGMPVQLVGSEDSISGGLLSGVLSVVVPDEIVVLEGETTATFDVTASLVGSLLGLLVDHEASVTASLNAVVEVANVLIEAGL